MPICRECRRFVLTIEEPYLSCIRCSRLQTSGRIDLEDRATFWCNNTGGAMQWLPKTSPDRDMHCIGCNRVLVIREQFLVHREARPTECTVARRNFMASSEMLWMASRGEGISLAFLPPNDTTTVVVKPPSCESATVERTTDMDARTMTLLWVDTATSERLLALSLSEPTDADDIDCVTLQTQMQDRWFLVRPETVIEDMHNNRPIRITAGGSTPQIRSDKTAPTPATVVVTPSSIDDAAHIPKGYTDRDVIRADIDKWTHHMKLLVESMADGGHLLSFGKYRNFSLCILVRIDSAYVRAVASGLTRERTGTVRAARAILRRRAYI